MGAGKQTGYCYFQFKVKLNERSKTEDGKNSTGALSCLEILEAFPMLTVLVKAGQSHVCAVFFQFSVQANELMVFQFCLIFWVSVRIN